MDELVAILADTDNDGVVGDWSSGGGSGAEEYYALTDRRYDVVALLDHLGDLKERARFTAYGVARNQPFGDVTGDGEVDHTKSAPDNAAMIPASWSDPQYDPDGDLDRDGDVDSTDAALAAAVGFVAALPEGMVSRLGSMVGSTGAIYDPAVDLLLHRNRWRDAKHGRWLTRDPAGYVDGMSLYQYARSQPSQATDPSGLWVPGGHHIYPLYVGGRYDQIVLGLSAAEHGRVQSAFIERGYTWTNAGRAAWRAIGKEGHRNFLRYTLTLTNIPPQYIDSLVDDAMKGANPDATATQRKGTGPKFFEHYDSRPSGRPPDETIGRRLAKGAGRAARGKNALAIAVGVAAIIGDMVVRDALVEEVAEGANAGWSCQQYWAHLFDVMQTGHCQIDVMHRFAGDCQHAILTWELPDPIVAWDHFSMIHEEVSYVCSASQPSGGGCR